MERKISPPIISLPIQECGEDDDKDQPTIGSEPSTDGNPSFQINSSRSSFGDTTAFVPPGYVPSLVTPNCTPKLHPSPARSPSKTSTTPGASSSTYQNANKEGSIQYLQVRSTY